jgi:DNA (cytosine-5)-methyltransferase 1
MKFLSVCSGIEAASVAWHPLGWESVAYSEIEPFPCKVLQHHYPDVPNLGDMTKFKEWPDADVDVFVGGTPCQSFSVAGLRKGLDDPRGNLMLTFLAIAKRYCPNWLVWENVPGVLSSADGRDFGSFLGGLAILGYGFAYRVLDAQYFGVAQRRKRVFVVGYLGDWRPAAAVLFERYSLQGHPAPSREKGKSFAASIASGAPISDYDVAGTLDKGTPGRGIGHNGNYDSQVVSVGSLYARTGQSRSVQDAEQGHLLATQPIPIDTMNHIGRGDKHSMGDFVPGAPSYTLTKGHSHAVAQPIPFDTTQITSKANYSKPQPGDPCHPLAAGAHPPAILQPIAFSGQMSNPQTDVDMTQTLQAKNPMAVAQAMAVRRLTPVECERLQGFGDNYTDIKPNGKATPDGPRYKALGNSMAVPVMAWIGKRIQEVDAICKTQQNT